MLEVPLGEDCDYVKDVAWTVAIDTMLLENPCSQHAHFLANRGPLHRCTMQDEDKPRATNAITHGAMTDAVDRAVVGDSVEQVRLMMTRPSVMGHLPIRDRLLGVIPPSAYRRVRGLLCLRRDPLAGQICTASQCLCRSHAPWSPDVQLILQRAITAFDRF